jgi:hypothetical protein
VHCMREKPSLSHSCGRPAGAVPSCHTRRRARGHGAASAPAAAYSSALLRVHSAPSSGPLLGPSCSTRSWKRTREGRWPTLMRVTPASRTARYSRAWRCLGLARWVSPSLPYALLLDVCGCICFSGVCVCV